jgi:hypothetical protein
MGFLDLVRICFGHGFGTLWPGEEMCQETLQAIAELASDLPDRSACQQISASRFKQSQVYSPQLVLPDVSFRRVVGQPKLIEARSKHHKCFPCARQARRGFSVANASNLSIDFNRNRSLWLFAT